MPDPTSGLSAAALPLARGRPVEIRRRPHTAVLGRQHQAGRVLFPAAHNESGSQIINLSSLKELCSWDSLQMGYEKALGKLQKERTLQSEKWMHIYQLWVRKEQAPSTRGHCRNRLQSCTDDGDGCIPDSTEAETLSQSSHCSGVTRAPSLI